MEKTTKGIAADFEIKGEGGFEVAFSPFDVVDLDRDVVRRSAIQEGQRLPLIWAHDSHAMPVGTGAVRHSQTHAVLAGDFIKSTAGLDARATLKETKDFQEFSWGFFVKESNAIEVEGESVREIVKSDPIEVSAVLRGAAGFGRTRVASIKEAKTSFKDEMAATAHALTAAIKRAQDLQALRAEEGRDWPGPEAAEALKELLAGSEEAARALAAMVPPEEDPEDVVTELKRLREQLFLTGE